RMAADRALPENDHRAREYVRALDGNRYRHALVTARQIVARPHAYALAAMHVHRIVHHDARELGQMIFDDGGHDRRFLAEVDRTRGHHARGFHQISVAADTRDRFLDASEMAYRHFELRAHASVRAGRQR